MKLLLKGVVICLLASAQLAAGTTKGGNYGACISEESYKEWNGADTKGMARLMRDQKCFILKSGLEYNIIDRGWMSSVVRVYVGGGSIKLWVPNEAL